MRDKLTMPQKIFWAIFMLIGSIFIFMQFSELETHGGNLRLPVIVLFIYERIGKWGVFGVSMLIAASLFVEIPEYVPKKNPNRGQSLKFYVDLEFREIIFGCDKTIQIQHLELIGNGKIASVIRDLTFTIPPGIHSGVNFMLVGEGDASLTGNSGDLFIAFENLPSEGNGMKREGSNIISHLEITRLQAQQGDRVSVNTLSGVSDVIIPPGTKNGDRLVIRDRGLLGFNPRECFKFSAGTCRDKKKNVSTRMFVNPFSPQIRGHHIVCINMSVDV
jgi:DnaJ C terminal domain